jgi:hypothetical protein
MKKLTDPANSLTEARRQSGPVVSIVHAGGSSASNTRRIPYAERYGQLTGIYETPIEHLQRAAEDEAARADAGRDGDTD